MPGPGMFNTRVSEAGFIEGHKRGGIWTPDAEADLPPDWAKKKKDDKIKFLLEEVLPNYSHVNVRYTMPDGGFNEKTFRVDSINKNLFLEGFPVDGSSYVGGEGIEHSDISCRPALSATGETIYTDYFTDKTDSVGKPKRRLVIIGKLYDADGRRWKKDPRYVAQKAQKYLAEVGATAAFIGPEPEYFTFKQTADGRVVQDEKAVELAAGELQAGGMKAKRAYTRTAPSSKLEPQVDDVMSILSYLGIKTEGGIHEVAPNQLEVNFQFANLKQIGDRVQKFKWVVEKVAEFYNYFATFSPKPVKDDNGSGMHLHFSMFNGSTNMFAAGAGDTKAFAGLSQEALWAMGGIFKHIDVIMAFTNPTVESFERLKPGFEAPSGLAYDNANRDATIRVPAPTDKDNLNQRRFEFRAGDPTANIYFASSVLAMAAIDGIKNKIYPGKPGTAHLHHEGGEAPKPGTGPLGTFPTSLQEVRDALADPARTDFLLQGKIPVKDGKGSEYTETVFTKANISSQLKILDSRIQAAAELAQQQAEEAANQSYMSQFRSSCTLL